MQVGKCPWSLADHLAFNCSISVLLSKYQRFLLKGDRKELNILVFGTNIPAGWHQSPYCNITDNSSDHNKSRRKVPGDPPREDFPFMVKREWRSRDLVLKPWQFVLVVLENWSSEWHCLQPQGLWDHDHLVLEFTVWSWADLGSSFGMLLIYWVQVHFVVRLLCSEH